MVRLGQLLAVSGDVLDTAIAFQTSVILDVFALSIFAIPLASLFNFWLFLSRKRRRITESEDLRAKRRQDVYRQCSIGLV